MTNQQHPITPPSELLQLWFEQHDDYNKGINELLIEAVQYGADQELEACCEWLASKVMSERKYPALRAARRPEPMSLKEQALEALGLLIPFIGDEDKRTEADTIRRALEQLND